MAVQLDSGQGSDLHLEPVRSLSKGFGLYSAGSEGFGAREGQNLIHDWLPGSGDLGPGIPSDEDLGGSTEKTNFRFIQDLECLEIGLRGGQALGVEGKAGKNTSLRQLRIQPLYRPADHGGLNKQGVIFLT